MPLTFTRSMGSLQGGGGHVLKAREGQHSAPHPLNLRKVTLIFPVSCGLHLCTPTHPHPYHNHHWLHFLDLPEWRCTRPGRPGNWRQWSEQKAHSEWSQHIPGSCRWGSEHLKQESTATLRYEGTRWAELSSALTENQACDLKQPQDFLFSFTKSVIIIFKW